MKALSIHAGNDTGGVSWGLTGAFARASTDVELRSVIRSTNYLDYPKDADWDTDAVDLWNQAEVVHLHNTIRTSEIMSRYGCARKPTVLHHHGTHYRDNYQALNAWVHRRNQAGPGAGAVVATLDLLEYGPELDWCPAAMDLPWLAKFRRPVPGVPGVDRPLRVGHAPTDRAIKSTGALLEAAAQLPLEVVLIEGQTWTECLTIKGTVDVYFDQVILGYGNNAIESWAMGIPVICGASDFTLDLMVQRFGDLPFLVSVGEAGIHRALQLASVPDTRDLFAVRGTQHARKWHDGTQTVKVLSKVYQQVSH